MWTQLHTHFRWEGRPVAAQWMRRTSSVSSAWLLGCQSSWAPRCWTRRWPGYTPGSPPLTGASGWRPSRASGGSSWPPPPTLTNSSRGSSSWRLGSVTASGTQGQPWSERRPSPSPSLLSSTSIRWADKTLLWTIFCQFICRHKVSENLEIAPEHNEACCEVSREPRQTIVMHENRNKMSKYSNILCFS